MFTAFLIAVLIVAGAATVVGGGLVLASNRRKALGTGGDGAPMLGDGTQTLIERGLGEMRVGDIVQQDGIDYLVEGVVIYDEDGHKWRAGRLVDGRNVHWLVAGMNRIGSATDLRIMTPDDELDISGYPPQTLLARGVRYNLDKRGTASAKFSGEVGDMPGKRGDKTLDTVERCRWWRYESAGDGTLIVEQWGGEYRALTGKSVQDGMIEMIPGS